MNIRVGNTNRCLLHWIALSIAASLAGSPFAFGQTDQVLTIRDAVAAAMKENRQVQVSGLDVDKARENTAGIKDTRLPQFQTYVLGGEAVRPITFSIPRGALGYFPATGPIPGQNATVTTPQQFTAAIFAQVSQPLSQLWKIRLAIEASKLGESMASESLRQQRQDTAQSVRDLYYQIVQTQTQIESAESNEKYLVELQEETDRNLAAQTALKGDSLSVKAKLSQQRYQLITLHDTIATQKESLNRLLGRDLGISFSVETQPMPGSEEIDLAAARQEAIANRAEVRQARLQVEKAETDVRRERAEYIPELSAHLTYFSLPSVSFAPQNILEAGFMLQWQPWDWGQKHHVTRSLEMTAQQSSLNEQDAAQQVTLDVNSKFRALAESRALLDTAALSQESEREKLRVMTNRYHEKAALLADVLQQEAAVTQSDADYRKAVAGFWKAKASFERALGRE